VKLFKTSRETGQLHQSTASLWLPNHISQVVMIGPLTNYQEEAFPDQSID